MPDRRLQILALLESRFDGLPEVVRRDASAAGFVHVTLAPAVCPVCEGVDCDRCPGCRGSGSVEVARRRDPYATDRVTPYGLESTTKVGHVPERDAELARLEAQTARPPVTELDLVAVANLHPFGWERVRAAMYARYDYRALDVGLERLAGMAVGPTSPRGLVLLSLWLPRPLRAPVPRGSAAVVVNAAAKGRTVDGRAREARDRAAVELLEQGVPAGEVAARVGLSARQLRRIANGEVAA